ncbi:uncharacterized protein LOC127872883 isoform X4 [Dreissena polymorpha]|uniref:OCIA domain-containing protein n=1 Tax=Dreissena polymorpha TaxID=45954 RepID=A0A9D4QVT6_DREPO|nr:uncharacterized protein LOC127872883 isoform X4 [Dreissena polymorpha]KAH3844858.1 hypothetical protein DPMN_087124 [Dreissena polymorpha]
MALRLNPQLLQKMNNEEKAVVTDVTTKYLLYFTFPLGLGCLLGIRQLIKIGYMSPKYKVFKYGVGGFTCLNIGTFLTEREINRRLMAEQPNGLYSTLKKLTDEEKMQYITVMRKKGFVYPQEVFPEKFADSVHVEQQTTTERPGSDVQMPPSSGNVSSSPYGGMPGLGRQVDTDTETNKPSFSYRIARQKYQSSDSEESSTISTNTELSSDETTPSQPPSLSQPPSKLRLRKNKYGDEME